MNDLLVEFLYSICQRQVYQMQKAGSQLLSDGWEIVGFETQEVILRCRFTKLGATVDLYAPSRGSDERGIPFPVNLPDGDEEYLDYPEEAHWKAMERKVYEQQG